MEHREPLHDPLDKAPMLRSLKGAPDPFVVPDAFFVRFPHTVQGRAVATGSRSVNWSSRLVWALGMLALVATLWFALPQGEGSGTLPQHTEFALDVHPEELPVNEHLVWDVYADAGQPLFGEVLLELDERELHAYLEHENVDVELLMLEL
jgi:hypothetical protein